MDPIRIHSLDPSYTLQAKAFNVQPDGVAALAVVGTGLPSGAEVLWNGQPLKTGGGGSQGWVGAAVPGNLYSTAGTAAISVRDPGGSISNALTFKIYPSSGPAPEITALYPTGTTAGTPFNVQPSGDAALGVIGKGFLPDATIYIGGKELKTGFSDTSLSVSVPSAAFSKAGNVSIWVKNIDGKISNKAIFKVIPKD